MTPGMILPRSSRGTQFGRVDHPPFVMRCDENRRDYQSVVRLRFVRLRLVPSLLRCISRRHHLPWPRLEGKPVPHVCIGLSSHASCEQYVSTHVPHCHAERAARFARQAKCTSAARHCTAPLSGLRGCRRQKASSCGSPDLGSSGAEFIRKLMASKRPCEQQPGVVDEMANAIVRQVKA